MSTELVRRVRAWAPATKGIALFLLPVPLIFAALAGLIAGDLDRLAFTGGALTSIWGAATLTVAALAAEARYFLGERPDPPLLPLKLLSAIVTAFGVTLAAIAGGHTVAGALVFAALALAGHMAFYGRDIRPPRISVSVVDGIDTAAVTLQLKQAYGRLRGIESAANAIAVPEFRERLSRITETGRRILGEIARDPRDAARARRFLNLYLDSTERVTTEYARTHRQLRDRPLEDNFRKLLVEIEHTFAEQQRKLVERETLSLDVDIEVLNARLKHEGLG
jgi:hypothetical protein